MNPNTTILFAIILLFNGCIAKSEQVKNYTTNYTYKTKYKKLPMSKQFCIGDSCRASFAISKKREPLVSIQVGAFRRYAGAKVYARRYGLLSSKYKTVIKNGFKDNRPIYRVQIEGFLDNDEANAFIEKYPILSYSDSFLVSR